MQVTFDIPDELIPKLENSGYSVRAALIRAVENLISSDVSLEVKPRKPLLQTRTWELCGMYEISDNESSETNYAESVDEVLYENLL